MEIKLVVRETVVYVWVGGGGVYVSHTSLNRTAEKFNIYRILGLRIG